MCRRGAATGEVPPRCGRRTRSAVAAGAGRLSPADRPTGARRPRHPRPRPPAGRLDVRRRVVGEMGKCAVDDRVTAGEPPPLGGRRKCCSPSGTSISSSVRSVVIAVPLARPVVGADIGGGHVGAKAWYRPRTAADPLQPPDGWAACRGRRHRAVPFEPGASRRRLVLMTRPRGRDATHRRARARSAPIAMCDTLRNPFCPMRAASCPVVDQMRETPAMAFGSGATTYPLCRHERTRAARRNPCR